MTAGPRKLNSRVGFPATSWSLVNSAGRSESQCRDALESLCRGYWPPIYAELRRRNYSPSDAQDLTQEFFACLLRRLSFGSADRERGKFRSYLLGALDFFLIDRLREKSALKRGSGEPVVSLDAEEGEAWLREQPATGSDAATSFDQRWAFILMDRALDALREEYIASGRREVFDAVQPFLAAETGTDGYEAACQKAGTSVEAFTVAVHRFRKRFRSAVREQVGTTVATPAEADAEMRHLFGGG